MSRDDVVTAVVAGVIGVAVLAASVTILFVANPGGSVIF